MQIGVEDIKTIVWQEILKRRKFKKTPFHSSLCENRFQFESVQMGTYETLNYPTGTGSNDKNKTPKDSKKILHKRIKK